MTTYVDTAFAFTGEAITVGEAPRSDAAGKAAQAVGILGDVNNDNQVDIADALLVLLYTLERISFVAPNQGNIAPRRRQRRRPDRYSGCPAYYDLYCESA